MALRSRDMGTFFLRLELEETQSMQQQSKQNNNWSNIRYTKCSLQATCEDTVMQNSSRGQCGPSVGEIPKVPRNAPSESIVPTNSKTATEVKRGKYPPTGLENGPRKITETGRDFKSKRTDSYGSR